MINYRRWLLAAPSMLLSTVLAVTTTLAAPTAKFSATTFAELNKGEPQGTLISSKGEITAGRVLKRLNFSEASMIFSSVRAADGTLYLGTGDEAWLLAVKNDQVRKVADLQGVLVTALALGPRGTIIAATMPEARLLEIDAGSGKWKELARLPAAHIWSLLYDTKTQKIFAATGAPGKIFSIPASGGKAEEYFDSGKKHLLCLAQEKNGNLLTGSADNAILFRIYGAGRANAVHDFDASELRDIVVTAKGLLYVAVNKFEAKTSGMPRFDATEENEEGTAIKFSSEKAKKKVRQQELRPGAKSGKGAIFRLTPDGDAEQVFALEEGYFTDLDLDKAQTLWAGEGTEGKVYLLRDDDSAFSAFDVEERQALTLAVSGDDQYIATGDAGAIYRVERGIAPKAAYLSPVIDGKFQSRWGALYFQGLGNLSWESRSGNTLKPDKTWSGWSRAKNVAAGLVRLDSAASRYLQVRSILGDEKSTLRAFNLFYLTHNQQAKLTEITFGDADKKESKEKTAHLTKLKIKWKIENPDNDQLVYRVYYREEMGVTWREISGPTAIDKTEFEWDTESIPDGYYRVKVVASDERDNAPELMCTDYLVSSQLLIDNRKPDIIGLAVKGEWATGLARDSYSPLTRLEYSLDGDEWKMASLVDGIYDSPAEAFRVKLPNNLYRGTHVLAVRAYDSADNIGVNQIRFVVP